MREIIIKVISNSGIEQYPIGSISKEMAGQKAMGLLSIPEVWRLPFFVIGRDISEKFMMLSDEQQEPFCTEISSKIRECVGDFDMSIDQIIIRSSGEEEGMNERGRYESVECKIDAVDENFLRILMDLKKQGENPIAYIVQPYVNRRILGHLSNERRISQYARDWKVEYEGLDKEPYAIGIRTWRKIYNYKDMIEDSLQCIDENSIKPKLRKIAFYYTQIEKGQRVHFEFVWDGKRIYLVQKDIETEDLDAKNPMEYNIKVNNVQDFNLMIEFRRIKQEDGIYFKKVNNVLMYQNLGLITAPLYILDNKKIITDMSNGIFSESVKHDFLLFKGKSIVIRTDVAADEENFVQLLPRSNELRSYKDIVEWCTQNLCQIVNYANVAVLVHMFIPAISAAFAYAEPNSRIVTIQSLWGLPEGLYYNAHDTFLIDTGTKNIEHMDEERVIVNSIIKDHKAVYISPDDDGKWTEKKVKPPYDWKKSITNKQAKKIAIGSRLIAQNVGKAISVMWFVGIDEDYYNTDCLPWFHEIYGNNTFSHEIYKKKYYAEKEVVISSLEDLKSYEGDKNLRTITIHPKDDETLRNRDFIDKVGTFASKYGITIFLEGTILAHPVYALTSKGVKIILAKKNKELIGKSNFNKLVRDKIPDKIVGNMEQIKCYKAAGNVMMRYLKEKLVEEVFEVCDSKEDVDLLQEIADAYEVLLALQQRLLSSLDYKGIRRERVIWKDNEGVEVACISDKSLLTGKFGEHYHCKYGWIEFEVEREHQCIELEITITNQERNYNNISQNTITWKDTIVILAYQILDENNKVILLSKCEELLELFDKKINEMKILSEDFSSIRREKNDRNGAFENGFILWETQMRTETPKADSEFELPIYAESVQEEYPELFELLFDSVTYSDYREGKSNELIIRIKYPLCLNIWQNEFSGKNVEGFFGKNSRLLIKAERKKMYYSFTIYLLKESYEQLTFVM